MNRQVTRRAVLGGLLSGAAGVAFAEAPLRSLRPALRPSEQPIPRISPPVRPNIEDIIANADLGGNVCAVLVDANSGQPFEAIEGEAPLPPASVTKALTAIYALDALGGSFRFVTRIFAVGEVSDGKLNGDLILAGGGDPTLSTDHLAELAMAVKAAGIDEVTGRLLCWRGALPYAEEIEPSQLDHLGYNPSLSGLNLNFNRVHFEWARSGGDYRVTLDARTERYRPDVTMAQMQIVNRQGPTFTNEGPDRWTVARAALGNGGSRWMPVRQPALYAGDVFRTMAASEGVRMGPPVVVDTLPEGRTEIASHSSATLRRILEDMMLYSTNLTAEVCGLAATQTRQRRTLGIEASAQEMNNWLAERYGVTCAFTDHSGLSDRNRVSGADMVKILHQVGPDGPLRPLMKRIVMRGAENERIEDYPIEVRAKTGTLNFVSTLSGYVRTAEGRDLAFAIFAADVERRERGKASGDEVPAGSVDWNRRAKRLQQQLLQRWGLIYAG